MAGIRSAWIYKGSGEAGFLRAGEVHITDRGNANVTKLGKRYTNLPAGWDDPDFGFGTYNSGEIGFIKSEKVWVTDWDVPRLISSHFPTPPEDWKHGGINSAWIYPSGEAGFLMKGEVHITDRGKGNRTLLKDRYKNLPTGWELPDFGFGTYKSGEIGFIKGDQVWVTDWDEPRLISSHFPTLPDDWKN
ncbi:hypothetical protein ACFY4B_42195 [Kitasatospora sp. NPDC001261]|uniref:hypothetical protein n=1 Tax=Kitasatospora sp. NPDC001261 TaxID=3364012 RepID=UPI0036A4A283